MATWDIEKAVAYAQEKALPKSDGYCARSVKAAIKAGGIVIGDIHLSAKDYVKKQLKVYLLKEKNSWKINEAKT